MNLINNLRDDRAKDLSAPRYIKERSRNHCCRGKAIILKYYKRVSVFLHHTSDRQYAFLLPRIILLSVAWLSYHLLSLCLINGRIFGKKVTENKIRAFSQQLLSETFLIIRRIQRDITINVRRSSSKVPVILVSSYSNLNFLADF